MRLINKTYCVKGVFDIEGSKKTPCPTSQFEQGGVACIHLIKCLAYYFHILTVLPTVARPLCHFVTSPHTVGSHPICQALRLLKFLRCGADNSRCRTVRHLVLVTLDTLSDSQKWSDIWQEPQVMNLRLGLLMKILNSADASVLKGDVTLMTYRKGQKCVVAIMISSYLILL